MKVGDLVSHWNYGYGVVLQLGGHEGFRVGDVMVRVNFSDRIEEVWSADLEPPDSVEFGVHYE